MKVSIITPVLNNVNFIDGCLASVAGQDYIYLEHIIVDGGSTDGTLEVINRYKGAAICISNGKDRGMYDALNQGIVMATGDVVGVLGADDRLANADVIRSIVVHFRRYSCEAVYGHLNFVSRNDSMTITRRWKTRPYFRKCLELGWMPPHPALYVKKDLLKGHTPYSLEYGSCGDYDFILRLFYEKEINAVFLDKLIIQMLEGGVSNRLSMNLIVSAINDYRILVRNKIPRPLKAVLLKKLRKLEQLR